VSAPFEVRFSLEPAYIRQSLFAIELLDAVTLSRVSGGIKVVAEGIQGRPVVNSSGLFVWRREPLEPLTKVTIDPGSLPYERMEVARADLTLPPAPRPVTTIQLTPRADYPFQPGLTGMRGVLLEDRTLPRRPVAGADVQSRWLDADGNWRDAPTTSRTNGDGDFVSFLRFAASDVPGLDPNKALTARLRVVRDGATRDSSDLKLPQGRIADSSTLSALTFAWDELQP
jgi:hypothetical protein